MSAAHGIAESCIQYKDNPADGASAKDTFLFTHPTCKNCFVGIGK